MCYSDWIQLSLAFLTLAGLITVWLLHFLDRHSVKKDQSNRIRKRVSLYLDVVEIKLEKELVLLNRGRGSQVISGKFEENNQRNYNALEDALQKANVLDRHEYNTLFKFVRNFKVSENMENESDINCFLGQIRDPELRRIFPQGSNLSAAIDQVKGKSNNQ